VGAGVRIIIGDALEELRKLPDESVDCCVTSPPYWGLRSYLDSDDPNKAREMGLERTLGEHLDALVTLFREVRRVLKPSGTCFINYGDCYATAPNGRLAAETKAAGTDDRTFRDKPFSTVGPIYDPDAGMRPSGRRDRAPMPKSQIRAGGTLKPKDLCMVPQRLFIALQADGWWVRSIMPWVKRNGMPESISDRPANSIEYVAFLTKSPRYWYDAEAVRRVASANTHARTSQKMPDGWDTGPGGHGSFHRNGREKGKTKLVADRSSGIKANETYRGVVEGDVLHDRNFRNTDLFFDSLIEPWGLISDADGTPLALDVTPQAFREAHFATFPPGLIDPLIRAGCPERCCSECGKPWVRVVTKGEPIEAGRAACGADASGGYAGQATKDYAAAGAQNPSDVKRRILEGMRERHSAWEPGCKCDADVVPGTVLDPFFGAGTTGLVASRLRRDCIGIELDPKSVEIARARIRADLGRVECELPEKQTAGPLFGEAEAA
jgi:DNA modification methylase